MYTSGWGSGPRQRGNFGDPEADRNGYARRPLVGPTGYSRYPQFIHKPDL